MIEKEQAEIKVIKEEIQKKTSANTASGTVGGAPAAINWADDSGSSGKFKFIHVIVVSIIFLLLGSYLA